MVLEVFYRILELVNLGEETHFFLLNFLNALLVILNDLSASRTLGVLFQFLVFLLELSFRATVLLELHCECTHLVLYTRQFLAKHRVVCHRLM